MHWNNGIGSNYREERPTAPIYALRKEGRLEEANQIALRLQSIRPRSPGKHYHPLENERNAYYQERKNNVPCCG